jgi:Ni,Fe-hydrogenase III large subunit
MHREAFGHRYLMDFIVPGGVASDLDNRQGLLEVLAYIKAEVEVLRGIYEEHAGVQDRFIMTGRVPPELAARLGLTGPAARASGQARDLRVDLPMPPYETLAVRKAGENRGDVAARVTVRFEELAESIRLIEELVERLLPGGIQAAWKLPQAGSRGCGWIEGWRGEVFVAIEAGADGSLRRVHAHDPSWQNWPVLERAVLGNIVPDFPLINKSFNLSYSGHDL